MGCNLRHRALARTQTPQSPNDHPDDKPLTEKTGESVGVAILSEQTDSPGRRKNGQLHIRQKSLLPSSCRERAGAFRVFVEGSVEEHGEEYVGASAGDGDERPFKAFDFGAFGLIVGPSGPVVQRCECGEEQGACELLVPAAASVSLRMEVPGLRRPVRCRCRRPDGRRWRSVCRWLR